MIHRFLAGLILASLVMTVPVWAALKVGDPAPNFTLQASMGGKVFAFSLSDALKKGPVVLYFYPAAFTTGCTLEAHSFADAIDQYKKLDATVIGVSHDPIDVLNKFSVSDCRSKFAVAADTTLSVAKSYDAVLPSHAEYANRTSYVIGTDGNIAYTYTSLDPTKHVANTLDALTALENKK